MAAITSAQTMFRDGGSQKTVVLRLVNVTTGDTVDVASVGPVVFRKVEAAAFIGAAQGTAVVGSVAGTVITLTSSGMASDTVTLLVQGEG